MRNYLVEVKINKTKNDIELNYQKSKRDDFKKN